MKYYLIYIFVLTAVCVEHANHRAVEKQIDALEVKIAEYKGLKCEWPTDYQHVPWEQVREMEEP